MPDLVPGLAPAFLRLWSGCMAWPGFLAMRRGLLVLSLITGLGLLAALSSTEGLGRGLLSGGGLLSGMIHPTFQEALY